MQNNNNINDHCSCNDHLENSSEYMGLNVNKGVEQQPSVNPYIKKFIKKRKTVLTVDEYMEGILKGDRTILSKAITLVESNNREHQKVAQEIIKKCLPHMGNSTRVGISGVPGAGKSTFIEALGKHLTSNGEKLAVLAIDPSSERSKGSILGDKTRMERLSIDHNAYIRPSPSAGSLGGVARKTRETIVLCEAAGYNNILIETVGVGQSETAVNSMVDFFLLIQISGAGDELQGIKRGIMEMADGIVVNKADGSNLEKAQLAASLYKSVLHLFPPTESGWIPEVLTCSSIKNERIDEVWKLIEKYMRHIQRTGHFDKKRKSQAQYWMKETIDEALQSNFYDNPNIKELLKSYREQVENGEISSFVAASSLLNYYFNK